MTSGSTDLTGSQSAPTSGARGWLAPWPRRLLLLLLLLGLVGLRWCTTHPLVWSRAAPEEASTWSAAGGPADLLLVLDPVEIRRAAGADDFRQGDWSHGWSNLVAQEVGPVARLAPGELTAAALRERRVVIVTRSARASALEQLEILEDFVEAGGVLLLEQPGPALATPNAGRSWTALSQVELADDVAWPAGPLQGPELGEETNRELSRVPRLSQRLRLRCRPPARPVWLADGEAVACRADRGRGSILTLGLDLGRLLTAIQQGMPTGPGFRLTNRHPSQLSPHLESNDLVADPALLQNELPVADRIERVVARLLEVRGPLPRWWGFPEGRPGAYLTTHDEEAMGDRAAWLADAEADWGVRSTWFVVSSPALTAEGLRRMQRAGELGLHWNRDLRDPLDPNSPVWRLGWGPLRPLVIERSLEEQLAEFQEKTGERARINRNHYLLWDRQWARPFRQLAAAGITGDSTYGPDLQCRGYLFGTGRPFQALAEDGLPLPIWELPFQTAEELGGADRAFLQELLRRSADRDHTAVVTLFHPNVYGWRPRPAISLMYQEAFLTAQQLELWVTGLGTYLAFDEARRAALLTSTFTAGRLNVLAEAVQDGQTVAAAWRWEGFELHEARRDGQPVGLLSRGNGPERVGLVPLTRGRHRLEFLYAPRKITGGGP